MHLKAVCKNYVLVVTLGYSEHAVELRIDEKQGMPHGFGIATCLPAGRRNSNKNFYLELCKMIMLNIEIANVISLDVNPERR